MRLIPPPSIVFSILMASATTATGDRRISVIANFGEFRHAERPLLPTLIAVFFIPPGTTILETNATAATGSKEKGWDGENNVVRDVP